MTVIWFCWITLKAQWYAWPSTCRLVSFLDISLHYCKFWCFLVSPWNVHFIRISGYNEQTLRGSEAHYKWARLWLQSARKTVETRKQGFPVTARSHLIVVLSLYGDSRVTWPLCLHCTSSFSRASYRWVDSLQRDPVKCTRTLQQIQNHDDGEVGHDHKGNRSVQSPSRPCLRVGHS